METDNRRRDARLPRHRSRVPAPAGAPEWWKRLKARMSHRLNERFHCGGDELLRLMQMGALDCAQPDLQRILESGGLASLVTLMSHGSERMLARDLGWSREEMTETFGSLDAYTKRALDIGAKLLQHIPKCDRCLAQVVTELALENVARRLED